MPDAGHEATEKLLGKLEKNIAKEFKTATSDMQAKLKAYLEETEAGRKKQESLLMAGKITQKDYDDWVFRHTMVGKRWEQMRDTLAADMHNANEIAKGMMMDTMPDVYALNMNYGTYQIETGGRIDTGFTLYNHDTAEYLLGDQRQLMPVPSAKKAAQIAANKDMQWNKKKIQSAVLQGILQGESPYDVAKRLQNVGQMNYNSAVRYARTMTTSAQNAGRYEAFRRADKLGVDLTIEWQATLDDRTRHDHRLMHGQRRNVDEPFKTPDGFEILYPADCTGDSYELQGEIWNCRCTLLSWVKGFEGDTVKDSPKMDGMSFEEWQNDKAEKPEEVTPEEVKTDEKKSSLADNYYAFLGCSDEFKHELVDILEACDNEDAKAIYEKFAEDVALLDDKYKGGAHFSAYYEGCKFNAKKVKLGDTIHRPFETAFHEFGHNLDFVAGGENIGAYLSNLPIDGERLKDVIRWDYDSYKLALGSQTDKDFIRELKKNIKFTAYNKGNVSDILEFCTGIDYPLGVGHGVKYHKTEGQTEKEFFTEVISSAVANKESYEMMKEIFPTAVDMVWKMVRSVL